MCLTFDSGALNASVDWDWTPLEVLIGVGHSEGNGLPLFIFENS
jgi:hypothetical protein